MFRHFLKSPTRFRRRGFVRKFFLRRFFVCRRRCSSDRRAKGEDPFGSRLSKACAPPQLHARPASGLAAVTSRDSEKSDLGR